MDGGARNYARYIRGIIMIEKYLYRAIIRHLDGNKEKANKYANQATELYKKDKHLYVSIEDILKSKGEIA